MSGATVAVFQNQRSFGSPPGSVTYGSCGAGTYTWVAPAGVTKVSVVAVGGGSCGAHGSAGGNLAYLNNYTVVPGNSYTVIAGSGTPGTKRSTFISTSVLTAGNQNVSGCCSRNVGTAYYLGGNGGCYGGGGGAGGYSGAGGNGGYSGHHNGYAGTGGAGGGGAWSNLPLCGCINVQSGGGGGGVGLYGQGSSGSGGVSNSSVSYGGGAGSGGSAGSNGYAYCAGSGGYYGGGGGGNQCNYYGAGFNGAVRIVWPGNTRQFPSTCVGTP